jgi:plastocyanin
MNEETEDKSGTSENHYLIRIWMKFQRGNALMNRNDLVTLQNTIRPASAVTPSRIDRRSLLKAGGALGLTGLALGLMPRSLSSVSAHQDGGTPPAAVTPIVGPQDDGTNLWHVLVGGMDMENNLDFQGFFPGEITINAGDKIWFDSPMPGLHNAWFGYGAESPALLVPDPEVASPAAGEAPTLIFNPEFVFPTPNQVVDGVNPVNTGVDVFWDPATPTVVTFSTPGTYEYFCIPHQAVMRATVIVQEAGAALPMDQAGYDALAQEQLAALQEEGMAAIAEFAEATVEEQADGTSLWTAALGAGEGQARVMAILPKELEIKVGDSVKWIIQSPGEAHNITFVGSDQTPPEDVIFGAFADGTPKVTQNSLTFLPSGTTTFDGTGYMQSGFMGVPQLGLPMEFTGTFTAPGEFIYYCSLHGDAAGGGMAATLRVVE